MASAGALAVQALPVARARAATPTNPIITLVQNTATGVWETRVGQLPVGQRPAFAGGVMRAATRLGVGALRLRSTLALTLAGAALTGLVLPAINAYLGSQNTTFDPENNGVSVNEPTHAAGGSTYDDIVSSIGLGGVGWYGSGRFWIHVWDCPGGYDYGYCPTSAASAVGPAGQPVAQDDLVGQWRHQHSYQMAAHGTGPGKVVSVYAWRPGNGQVMPPASNTMTAEQYADKVAADAALDLPVPDAAVASVVNAMWAASENAPIPYNPAQPVTAADVATARGTAAPPTLRDLVQTPWSDTDTYTWTDGGENPDPDPNPVPSNGTWVDPAFSLPALVVPELPGPQQALETISAPLAALFPDLERPKPPCPTFELFGHQMTQHCILEGEPAQPALRTFGKLGWSVATFWMFLEALK